MENRDPPSNQKAIVITGPGLRFAKPGGAFAAGLVNVFRSYCLVLGIGVPVEDH